jgi:hypothetical protein
MVVGAVAFRCVDAGECLGVSITCEEGGLECFICDVLP